MIRRARLVALILALCIGVDLGSKALVRATVAESQPRYYLDRLLRFSHWENAGTIMSVGDRFPRAVRLLGFTVLPGLFGAGLLLFLILKPGLGAAQLMAGTLIAGGSLSNVIDRLVHDGLVLDFINISIAPLHLMIFNFADAAIALGAAILAFSTLRRTTM